VDFTNVLSDPSHKKGFSPFFDIAITAVCGRRNWTNNLKVSQTILACEKVSISDKAFAELVIKNYWDRWKSGGNAKWTDGRSGELSSNGWSAEGHQEFNEIYECIKAQRANSKSRELTESRFLELAQDAHGGARPKRRVGGEMGSTEEVMVDDW
jgi:hypothetical protein